jgi:uncharacterized paraquat-inducible protein A
LKKTNLQREEKTVVEMIKMYCKKNHDDNCLCDECRLLSEYAVKRLKLCRYGKDKPVCSKCKTHCYRSEMREKIKKVMRYSGPRMILYHPGTAIMHMYGKMRK